MAGTGAFDQSQAHYSDIAIETNLLLRSAFRLPLRQAQGLMAPVF